MEKTLKPDCRWNPFHGEVVESPWSTPENDVERINHEAFTRCCELLEEVRAGGGPQALFLFGSAGCGKTHLLSRFRRYVQKYAEADPASILIAVRLDCSAPRLWRHLRARMFRDLTLRREGNDVAPLRRLLEQARRRYARAGDWPTALDAAGGNYNLEVVLEHYHSKKYIRQASAWLRGDALPPRVLELLQIAPEDEDADGESEAKKLIFAAVRLFAPATFVFCFDQLEALEGPFDEHRGLGSFGIMAGELAELPNVLVVSSTISAYVEEIQQAIPSSFMQRISKHQVEVRPLRFEEARQLLAARLNSVPELRVRQSDRPLWPLETEQVRALFESQNGFCTARKLIHAAGVWYVRACGGKAEQESLTDRLERELEERLKASLAEPGHPDDVLLQGLQWVSVFTGRRCMKPRQPSNFDLSFGPESQTLRLVFCNQADGRSLAARIRKVAATPSVDRIRLRLLRDSGRPIGAGAVKTRERLEELQANGAKLIRPSREALAALDACRRLIADAQSGDLAFRGDAVDPASVREWLAKHLPDRIRDMIDEIGRSE